MAVREKTLTRTPCAVKHLATSSIQFGTATRARPVFLDCGGLAAAFEEYTKPPNSTVGAHVAYSPPAEHAAQLTSSDTSRTMPKSDSTGPPNASPHEIHAAP